MSANARVGGLVSFLARSFEKLCTTVPGVTETCQTSGLNSLNVLAFTLAAQL